MNDNTSVIDFVKIMNVVYELYDTNSLMFKIKFNTMVSDFKIYSFISKSNAQNGSMVLQIRGWG